MATYQLLQEEHLGVLASFFDAQADTTLFLRSNLAEAGLANAVHPYGGVWAGAFEGDALVGVAAHFNGGNVVVAGDDSALGAARLAVDGSGRQVRGVVGPWALAVRVQRALELGGEPALRSREVLYRLMLGELRPPPALVAGQVRCRPSRESDLPLLVEWRTAFYRESLGGASDGDRPAALYQAVSHAHGLGRLFVLEDRAGTPLATTAFNAWADGIAQVGGVFTPPEFRRCGYARAAVAGSLALAVERGAHHSVLFTREDNLAARRAYEALGYEAVGEYGLLLY